MKITKILKVKSQVKLSYPTKLIDSQANYFLSLRKKEANQLLMGDQLSWQSASFTPKMSGVRVSHHPPTMNQCSYARLQLSWLECRPVTPEVAGSSPVNRAIKVRELVKKKDKLTILDLKKKKAEKERLAMVAVGEFLSAQWAEAAGIDIIGVGDSLGMTLYGHENTLSVTVDQMIQHCRAVRKGAPNTFCILAMPYGSYSTKSMAIKNASKMMKESGADAIKLQCGKDRVDIISAVSSAGIPVMSHVGLLPHLVHVYGGFKMQGKNAEDAVKIIEDAIAIENAGAVGIEIEAVPAEVALSLIHI